jgi:oligopeptide transport system permease protein
MARIVRGQVLVLREMTFVTASRAMGQSSWGVLQKASAAESEHHHPHLPHADDSRRHPRRILPQLPRPRHRRPRRELGLSLLKDGAQVINPLDSKWWLLVFPALCMSASLLALNFLGDGLRDAFDPKSAE